MAGQLATAVVQLIVAWRLIPLRFSIRDGDRKTLRELMRYGRHVGLANVIDYGNASAEGIVVGRVLGAISLGYFSIAKRLASMPVEVLGNILGRGVFAAFARLHDDIDGSRRVWLANIQRLALVVMPATIGLVVVAEPLVLAILGEKWRPAVVPLQILALNCFVRVFSTTAGEAFQAQNRPKFRVYASTFHLVLIVPLLVLGSRWHGVDGAAAAVVCTNVLVGIPVIAVVMRMFRVTVAELVGSLLRPRDRLDRDDHRPAGGAPGCRRPRPRPRARRPRPRRSCRVRRRGRRVRTRDRRHHVVEPSRDPRPRLTGSGGPATNGRQRFRARIRVL